MSRDRIAVSATGGSRRHGPARAVAPSSVFRRRVLAVAGGIAAGTLVPGLAAADADRLEAAVLAFTGGVEPLPQDVTLEVAPLVENGNSVPVAVRVDSPMTAARHVRRIALFTEKNPQPQVAVFQLGPRGGRASVATRIRMADSQRVVAVAELSDGSFRRQAVDVIVTLAACIES
jgi:sulfur-oxidizing protein SoxY